MHKYRLKIVFKPGPDLFIAGLLSRHNHEETKMKKNMAIGIALMEYTL